MFSCDLYCGAYPKNTMIPLYTELQEAQHVYRPHVHKTVDNEVILGLACSELIRRLLWLNF